MKDVNFFNKYITIFIAAVFLISYQNCAKPFQSLPASISGESVLASSDQGQVPTVSIQSAPNSITNLKSVQVTYSAIAAVGAQIASIKCTLDAMAPIDCMQGFSQSNLSDGMHNLKIIATDNKGLSSNEKLVSWMVDTIAPTVNFLSAPADNSLLSSSSINITFSSPIDSTSGIDAIMCSYGSSASTITSNSINCLNNSISLNNLSAGPVYLRVKVVDKAQNIFNLDKNFTVQFNIPTVAILDPKPAAYSKITSFTFNFNGFYNGQALNTFECALDNQAFSACNGGTKNYLQSDLTEGAHTFKVRSVDVASNTKSGEQNYQFTIDRTAPSVVISAPAANAVLTANSVNATFTVTDTNLSTVNRVCRLDNVQLPSCNNSVALSNLTNGPHSFSVTATDGANNSSVVTRNFTVNVPVMVNKTLAWDPSVDANNAFDASVTSYNVYVGTAPGVFNSPVVAAASATPTQPLNNLVVGQTYYIAVSAVNVAGESSKSIVLTYVAQ